MNKNALLASLLGLILVVCAAAAVYGGLFLLVNTPKADTGMVAIVAAIFVPSILSVGGFFSFWYAIRITSRARRRRSLPMHG